MEVIAINQISVFPSMSIYPLFKLTFDHSVFGSHWRW